MKEEMLLLERAFKEIVSAVALSDADGVLKALEPLKGTMERTHEGLRSGAVRLRKNARRGEEFLALDRSFHHTLEELEGAAKRGDVKEMLESTKTLLDGCVKCHRTFR